PLLERCMKVGPPRAIFHFMRGLLFLLLLGPACSLSAQEYPARPFKLIVPFSVGGDADVIGRVLAEGLGEYAADDISITSNREWNDELDRPRGILLRAQRARGTKQKQEKQASHEVKNGARRTNLHASLQKGLLSVKQHILQLTQRRLRGIQRKDDQIREKRVQEAYE